MDITTVDIARFMNRNRACLDSRIWFHGHTQVHITAEELWHDLTRPDWRWWVLSRLGVSHTRVRAYLTNVARNLVRRAQPGGFSTFPVQAILGLADDPRSFMHGEQRATLGYLTRQYIGRSIGVDSFHFGIIEACENLAQSVLKEGEQSGYLKHAAVCLNYAISGCSSYGIEYDHEDVRAGFGWPELGALLDKSDFFNPYVPG